MLLSGPPREGGGAEGQLSPGPQPQGDLNLRNSQKLSKAPSKLGRVQGIKGPV